MTRRGYIVGDMDRQRHAFLLRIWFEHEPNPAGYAPALRGSVQQIGVEQVHYFNTFSHLIHTLEELTAWQDGDPKRNVPTSPATNQDDCDRV